MKNLKQIQDLKQIIALDIIARAIVEGFITGLHKSPYHGFSVEFSEHRPYNSGESIRFIDWKLYAHTEKLFVKKFEQDTNLRNFIVLDTSSSMVFPLNNNKANKIEFAIYISAALMYLFRKQRDANGLVVFSDKIDFFSQAKLNDLHFNYLISKLQNILDTYHNFKNKKTDLINTLHTVAEKIPKRSLVIILSDLLIDTNLSQLTNALQHLKYNHHEVIIFNVIDQKLEINFEFENRPFKFVDIETNEQIKLNPLLFKENYQKEIDLYFQQIRNQVMKLNIDFVKSDINNQFNEILLTYLLKRQKYF